MAEVMCADEPRRPRIVPQHATHIDKEQKKGDVGPAVGPPEKRHKESEALDGRFERMSLVRVHESQRGRDCYGVRRESNRMRVYEGCGVRCRTIYRSREWRRLDGSLFDINYLLFR
jgi:hypothetical protein